MARVGLVGVGNMGMGMAKNIFKSGHALSAYDIRVEPLLELERLGASNSQFDYHRIAT